MDSNWELIKKKGRNLAAIELLASPQVKMGKYGRSYLLGDNSVKTSVKIYFSGNTRKFLGKSVKIR